MKKWKKNIKKIVQSKFGINDVSDVTDSHYDSASEELRSAATSAVQSLNANDEEKLKQQGFRDLVKNLKSLDLAIDIYYCVRENA